MRFALRSLPSGMQPTVSASTTATFASHWGSQASTRLWSTACWRTPDGFLYRHNGITVQCDTIEREFFAKRATGAPISLTLRNASVVNGGAQTVTSANRAFEKDPDAVADAYVSVRIVSVQGGTPEGFAQSITKATNTQNHMERRDFIAIDPVQSEIQKDFKLSLDKEYVFRRGEMDPAPDSGCSVTEAATALACAYRDPTFAVRVKGSTEALWKEGADGAYTRLFGQQASAYQIWRSVQVLRAIRDELTKLRSELSGGRAASIADSGGLYWLPILFFSESTAKHCKSPTPIGKLFNKKSPTKFEASWPA